jgi:hypothetical protein
MRCVAARVPAQNVVGRDWPTEALTLSAGSVEPGTGALDEHRSLELRKYACHAALVTDLADLPGLAGPRLGGGRYPENTHAASGELISKSVKRLSRLSRAVTREAWSVLNRPNRPSLELS